jgi:rhomboid protease GluP
VNTNPPRASKPARLPIPWVCAVVIGGSIAVHLAKMYVTARYPPKTFEQMLALTLKFGALYVPRVRDGEWWRLVSYAFAHGSMIHLAFNMFATTALGVPLERRIGTARFAQLSLVTCLGSAALISLFPRGVWAPTVGASGVIFGWAAALLFVLSREQVRELGKMLLLNAALSLLPGVSWQGHLGGFLFGLPCGLLLRMSPEKFSTRTPVLAAGAAALAVWGAYRGG